MVVEGREGGVQRIEIAFDLVLSQALQCVCAQACVSVCEVTLNFSLAPQF